MSSSSTQWSEGGREECGKSIAAEIEQLKKDLKPPPSPLLLLCAANSGARSGIDEESDEKVPQITRMPSFFSLPYMNSRCHHLRALRSPPSSAARKYSRG